MRGVTRLHGRAGFLSPRELEVEQLRGRKLQIGADIVIVAPGSRPFHPPEYPVDHELIHDSDSILSMSYRPDSLMVLGGGVIAIEYASIFASLGAKVTVLDRGPRPLPFVEEEIVDHLVEQLDDLGVTYRPNVEVLSLQRDGLYSVEARLDGGDVVLAEKALVAIGRTTNTDWLHLENTTIECDARGRIVVDAGYRTAEPNVYAIGDVVGAPGLASTAMEQGRRAALHALGLTVDGTIECIPTGIYSIPEISCVGLVEAEARELHGDVAVGRARFEEISRGQISGSLRGLLKLVARRDSGKLLGVSIIGDGATELIHIGQAVMALGGTAEFFVDNVFNFPTLAECYKVAAYNGLNKLAHV